MASKYACQIELSVRLTDDSYETRLILPINADDEARRRVVSKWLELQQVALDFVRAGTTDAE